MSSAPPANVEPEPETVEPDDAVAVTERDGADPTREPAQLPARPGPGIVVTTSNDGTWEQFSRRLVPFMPPVMQQQAAGDMSALSAFVVRSSDAAPEDTVEIVGVRYALDDLSSHDALKNALQMADRAALWGQEATAGGETGDGHSVLSAGIGAAQASLTSRQPPVAVHVEYVQQGGAAASTLRETVYLLPTLTGLQMKSAVIAAFGLEGGFQDYFLRCDGDVFGSRTAIATHPGFREGCVLIMEDAAGRPKAIGHT